MSIVDDELVEAMESFFIGFNTDAPRVESPGHFVIITDNDCKDETDSTQPLCVGSGVGYLLVELLVGRTSAVASTTFPLCSPAAFLQICRGHSARE